jgi:hypothetical protein
MLTQLLVSLILATATADDFDNHVMVMDAEEYRIVVEPTPCTSSVLAFINNAYKARAKNVTYIDKKMTVPGCAIILPEYGIVSMLFEDLEFAEFPLDKFWRGSSNAKRMGLRG